MKIKDQRELLLIERNSVKRWVANRKSLFLNCYLLFRNHMGGKHLSKAFSSLFNLPVLKENIHPEMTAIKQLNLILKFQPSICLTFVRSAAKQQSCWNMYQLGERNWGERPPVDQKSEIRLFLKYASLKHSSGSCVCLHPTHCNHCI